MIESLSEVMDGQRRTLYGNVDGQFGMHRDGTARLLVFQYGQDARDDQMIALDGHQIAHLGRLIRAMVQHGGNLNDQVAPPAPGG
jgi:hypothetical protein